MVWSSTNDLPVIPNPKPKARKSKCSSSSAIPNILVPPELGSEIPRSIPQNDIGIYLGLDTGQPHQSCEACWRTEDGCDRLDQALPARILGRGLQAAFQALPQLEGPEYL